MKQPVLFFIFFIFSSWLTAQTVSISGNIPSYAGDILNFQYNSDHISFAEQSLGKCKVDKDGNFYISFDLDFTVNAFLYLGIYKAYLYIEPNKTYQIAFPPKKEKTQAEKLNPYFELKEIYAKIIQQNPAELNNVLHSFDNYFNDYFEANSYELYKKRQYSSLDTFINVLNDNYPDSLNDFFKQYKKYRVAYLRNFAYEKNITEFFEKYFKNEKVHLNNAAYCSLFKEIAPKYVYSFASTTDGIKLISELEKADDIFIIKTALEKVTGIKNDTLLEFTLITTLYDSFYKNDLSKQSIIKDLQLIKINSTIPEHIDMAQFIIYKTGRLMQGAITPDFALPDKNGKIINPEKFDGKYIYLNFFTLTSITCKNDFLLLKKIYEQHKDKMEIVSISIDEDFKNTIKFFKDNQYDWTFLKNTDTSDIIKQYDVRAYPTYYLIDPDGRLVMSPAAAPGEEFEARFFQLWDDQRRQKKRLEYRK